MQLPRFGPRILHPDSFGCYHGKLLPYLRRQCLATSTTAGLLFCFTPLRPANVAPRAAFGVAGPVGSQPDSKGSSDRTSAAQRMSRGHSVSRPKGIMQRLESTKNLQHVFKRRLEHRRRLLCQPNLHHRPTQQLSQCVLQRRHWKNPILVHKQTCFAPFPCHFLPLLPLQRASQRWRTTSAALGGRLACHGCRVELPASSPASRALAVLCDGSGTAGPLY